MSAQQQRRPAAWAALALVVVSPWVAGASTAAGIGAGAVAAAAVAVLLARGPRPAAGSGARLAVLGAGGLVALGLTQTLPLGPLAARLSPALASERSGAQDAWPSLSLHPGRTREDALVGGSALVVLLALAAGGSGGGPSRLLVAGASLHAVVGTAAFLVGAHLPGVEPVTPARAQGALASPNHFAALLAAALPLALTLAARRRPGEDGRGWWLCAGALAIGVAASASRSGALAAAVGVALHGLLAGRGVGRAALAGLAVVALAVGGAGLVARVAGADAVQDLALRASFWRAALEMASAHPLCGAGLGAYGQLSPSLVAHPRWVGAAHSDPLDLAAEGGLVGLGLGALLLLGLARRALRPGARTEIAGPAAGVAAALVASALEFSLDTPAVLWQAAALAGLLLASRTSARATPAGLRLGLGLLAVGLALGGGRLALACALAPRPGASATERAEQARRAASLSPLDAGWPLAEATARAELGDGAGALEAIQRARALTPRDPALRLERARLLLLTGQRDEALSEVEVAVQLAPWSPPTLVHAATLALWAGCAGEARRRALERCRQGLALDPALVGAAAVQLAGLGLSAQELLAALPEGAAARRRAAAALEGRSPLAVDVREALGEAPGAPPSDQLGAALARLARDPGAPVEATLLRALAALPAPAAATGLDRAAAALLGARRAARLLALCAGLERRGVAKAELARAVGRARTAAGRPDLALAALREAVEGGEAAAGLELGDAYRALGRREAAISAWRAALERVRGADEVSAWLRLAVSLAEGRDREGAEAALRRARSLAPADPALAAAERAVARLTGGGG